ncbi:DUF2889 domain-containing protein [Parahaliea mediterranea]|uniref:DUF2889 domain-containing protein n=1 Tax=Parahaliea mediterranea TaxID=651086 RepID=A0A939DG61_9GAMM|nr:DUF2889 domain-containing protein [Parahaliea mediterranea]MBN7796902.1 DUF2889 domain-containing protein [Parahaliea mediterranea]
MYLPISGHPLHTRSITVSLIWTPQERWRLRGEIIDLRKSGLAPMSFSLQPPGIIHHMRLEIDVSAGSHVIESVQSSQDVVAFEPTKHSAGESCRDPLGNLDALLGVRIDADFNRKLSQTFGGPRGCSHLLTLFHYVASVIPRALEFELGYAAERSPNEFAFHSNMTLDGFQPAHQKIELAVQINDVYLKPEGKAGGDIERLALENGLRFYTSVDTQNLKMREVLAAVRRRDADTMLAAWRTRNDWASELLDTPILPGLAGRAREVCRDHSDRLLLLEALLQLAPGYIQVAGALAEQWIVRIRNGMDDPGDRPLAGAENSCYMWRSGGALTRND